MLKSLKSAARDALPKRYQVPIKYWYGVTMGQLEPEMALLPFLVGKKSHVADIGGNRGTYAYRLQRLGARLEIFEPNPSCASILRSWARHLDYVDVHAVALSSEAGNATLHVPIDEHGIEHDASASIEPLSKGQCHDIDVLLRPLDSFGFSDLDFIKIDTEGHESSVLAGGRKTIDASHPALLIEIEQRHNPNEPITAIFERIASLGYRGFFLRSQRLAPIDQFDAAQDQSAAVFAGQAGDYFNNFVFLSANRLAAGDYHRLADRWIAH